MTKHLDPSLVVGSATITGVRRINLVTNPSFEVDATSWAVFTGFTASLATNTTFASSGTSCLRYTCQSAGNGAGKTSITLPVTVGTAYTGSATVWSPSSRVVTMSLIWLTGGGATISTSTGSGVTAGTTAGGTRLSVTGTAPATTVNVQMAINCAGMANTEVFYIDAVLLEASGTLNSYFDGGFTNRRWTGTAGKSTSDTVVIDTGGVMFAHTVATPTSGLDPTNKTYVDTADATTLASGKTYADTGDATTLTSSHTYSDTGNTTTLAAAKAYTDDAVIASIMGAY